MNISQSLKLDEMAIELSKISVHPAFDLAHFIVSAMSLREQPGALQVSRISPLACWFSAMLCCFGGGLLSGLMLAEPPIEVLTDNKQVLIASAIWYLMFYCPFDLVYSLAALKPFRLVLSILKEVNRTTKIQKGVIRAHSSYKKSPLAMIATGWVKGAGGGLLRNFEQLVRGVWKPETNELLKMSYPTKITLIGAVLFTLQQTHLLPLEKHELMFIYTSFNIFNMTRIIVTGSSATPFTTIENILFEIVFSRLSPYVTEAVKEYKPLTDNGVKPEITEAHENVDKYDKLDKSDNMKKSLTYEKQDKGNGDGQVVRRKQKHK